MSKHSKKENSIIALAYFHRYGWIAILLGCIFIFPGAVFMIFGVGFIADAIWSFVGYKCRWKHIFCSYQKNLSKLSHSHTFTKNQTKLCQTSNVLFLGNCAQLFYQLQLCFKNCS